MPEPELLTLGVVMILIEQRAISSVKDQELPEEEHREEIERQQPDYAIKIDPEPGARQSSFIVLDLNEQEIGANESSEPEEDVNGMFSLEYYAKQEASHPLLNDVQILKWTLQHIEVRVTKDYDHACNHPHAIKDFEFLVILISRPLREKCT